MKKDKARLWWENNFLRSKNGKLYLGDKEATEITEQYGTPLFMDSPSCYLERKEKGCFYVRGGAART